MNGPCSNEVDNNSQTATFETKRSLDRQEDVRQVDCAIIGAGAAGLQCAALLLEGLNSFASPPSNKENSGDDESYNKLSLVVLEARDRIGGRVLTTHQRVQTISGPPNGPSEVLLCRDHGAAWVHGTHECNPMMKLLAEECSFSEATESNSITKSFGILEPVFDGNPWIRPHTILHRHDTKGENNKSLISFFVDGKCIPDASDGDEGTGGEVAAKTSVIHRAIIRHYRMLREILSNYDSDDESDSDCQTNVDQLYRQLHRTYTEDLSTPMEDKEERELVRLLTAFYLYLMENWSGISMTETEVDELHGFLSPSSKSSDEEEKKDDQRLLEMPETDVQYVSAGDFIGSHSKVKTGMITVLKPLIRILEEHQKRESSKMLFLGEEVVSIIDKTTRVQIETKSGKIIEAKCCVSTIPLGCLQHSISVQSEPTICGSSSTTTAAETTTTTTTIPRQPLFQPRLRDEKVDAINSLWSGSYKKVFLTFDHIFWPKDPPIIGLVRSESVRENPEDTFPGHYLLLYNLWARDRNIPSVEAILCGDLGKWAISKPDKVIQQAVLDFIESAMGLTNLVASCTGCHVTRWEEDEFTRGSYSAFRLGTRDEHVDILGATEWEGRLVFAGEATENDHMGSVHAALMSGKRAATEILEFLPSRRSSRTSTTRSSNATTTTNVPN